MTGFHYMQKNSGGQITSIEISNISGEYCAIIPEWIINEMGGMKIRNSVGKLMMTM